VKEREEGKYLEIHDFLDDRAIAEAIQKV